LKDRKFLERAIIHEDARSAEAWQKTWQRYDWRL
jgi:hypothetical protein